MLRSVLKGVLFLAPLLMISIVLKSMKSLECPMVPCIERANDSATIYIIGSSRAQHSVLPSILETADPSSRAINLGSSNSSFLYNCRLAANLLGRDSLPKVILVELAELAILPGGDPYRIFTFQDIAATMKNHLGVRRSADDLRQLAFYTFNISNEIKKIVYPALDIQTDGLGFRADKRMLTRQSPIVLTTDMPMETEIPRALTEHCARLAIQLSEDAEASGSKVLFMLPLAMNDSYERSLVFSIFKSLPDSIRWNYSEEFLESIKAGSYWADDVHLNSAGATVYSTELSRFLMTRQ